MLVAKVLFWVSLALLVWTHVGYALAAALGARLRLRRVSEADIEPLVTVIVAAHNEEDVIDARVRNLLELDYPADRLEVVVASDASTDRTDEIVERLAAEDPRVKLVRYPRGGKVAAQNCSSRASSRRPPNCQFNGSSRAFPRVITSFAGATTMETGFTARRSSVMTFPRDRRC